MSARFPCLPILRTSLLTVLLLAVGAPLPGSAVAMAGHSMSGAKAAAPDMARMMTTALSTLQGLSGRAFDRAFLSMMIPHHRAAVAMSRAVLARSHDAAVRRWATGIVRSQQAEIGTMTALLRPLGGAEPQMDAMMSGMSGLAATVSRAARPDLAYLQGMVPHHASAVSMATLALQQSASPAILRLARDIVTAQAGEMYAFRRWLLAR